MVGRLVGAGELGAADRRVRKGLRNGLLASGGLALETGRDFSLVLTGALRAAGEVIVPAGAGMVSIALVAGAGSSLMRRAFGLPGIWLDYALDAWVRGPVLLVRWHRRSWLVPAGQTQRSVRGPL